MAPPSKKPQTFEAALSELEAIVSTMEAGKLPLDESLAKYQRGIELLRECNGALRAAEQKIAILEADGLREITAAELTNGRADRSSGDDLS